MRDNGAIWDKNSNQMTEMVKSMDLIRPSGDVEAPFKALLFDSWHDTYVGVVCLMAVINGRVKKGKSYEPNTVDFQSMKIEAATKECANARFSFEF